MCVIINFIFYKKNIYMDNINLIIEAKKSYTNELISIIKSNIYNNFIKIYNESESDNKLVNFQNNIKNIRNWNKEIVLDYTSRITMNNDEEYINDLLHAVFLSNIKILISINNCDNESVSLTKPTLHHFIHKCYIEASREFYKNPFLFDENNKNKVRQQYLRESLSIIDKAIHNSIRKLLPIKNILKKYLRNSNLKTRDRSRSPSFRNLSRTEPTTESTTEPTTESTTESTTEPTTKSTTESTTKPTTKPTTESTTEPTNELEEKHIKNSEKNISAFVNGNELSVGKTNSEDEVTVETIDENELNNENLESDYEIDDEQINNVPNNYGNVISGILSNNIPRPKTPKPPSPQSQQTPEQTPEQTPDTHTHRHTPPSQQTPDQTPDQTLDQTPDQTLDQTPEEEVEEDSEEYEEVEVEEEVEEEEDEEEDSGEYEEVEEEVEEEEDENSDEGDIHVDIEEDEIDDAYNELENNEENNEVEKETEDKHKYETISNKRIKLNNTNSDNIKNIKINIKKKIKRIKKIKKNRINNMAS